MYIWHFHSRYQQQWVLAAKPPPMVQWYQLALLRFCMLFPNSEFTSVYLITQAASASTTLYCRASNDNSWYFNPHFSCFKSDSATTNLEFCSQNKYCKNQTESNVVFCCQILKSSFNCATTLAVCTSDWIRNYVYFVQRNSVTKRM